MHIIDLLLILLFLKTFSPQLCFTLPTLFIFFIISNLIANYFLLFFNIIYYIFKFFLDIRSEIWNILQRLVKTMMLIREELIKRNVTLILFILFIICIMNS
jgi:hypothetical protein